MEDLRRTMAALAIARAAADGKTWSRHVTDEFVVIHPDGRIHDRADEIAELDTSKPTSVLVAKPNGFIGTAKPRLFMRRTSFQSAVSWCEQSRSGFVKDQTGNSGPRK
jgi:hypothetical protein